MLDFSPASSTQDIFLKIEQLTTLVCETISLKCFHTFTVYVTVADSSRPKIEEDVIITDPTSISDSESEDGI